MLSQLVYYSKYRPGSDKESKLEILRKIVAVSQVNNARDGITGFLIFDGVWFIQVLEGDEAAVRATYDRIAKDPRHSGSTVMAMSSVADRSFPSWSMGGSMRSVEARDIYLAHGVGSVLDPRKIRNSDALSLAIDLQAHEQSARSAMRLVG